MALSRSRSRSHSTTRTPNWATMVEDRATSSPDEAITAAVLTSELDKLLTRLGERERHILRLRFGLDGWGEPHTLDEVGASLGLTRDRIRQIEAKALCKLRHPAAPHNAARELLAG